LRADPHPRADTLTPNPSPQGGGAPIEFVTGHRTRADMTALTALILGAITALLVLAVTGAVIVLSLRRGRAQRLSDE
jgi:hypothetical protein